VLVEGFVLKLVINVHKGVGEGHGPFVCKPRLIKPRKTAGFS